MTDATIEILATDLGFPEAPVALADGTILFTELAARTVTRLDPDGRLSRTPVGGSPNGLALGPDGALYICNNGGGEYRPGHFMSVGPSADYRTGSIQRLDLRSGALRTLYTHGDGNPLSAPNDLVFDRQGGFYFTDLGKRLARHRDYGGLYYAQPDGSRITAVVYPMLSPNGVGLSPDETELYVADTETARLLAFEIMAPGEVRKLGFPAPFGARVVCGLPGFQRFDSLAVQADGAICVATLVTGNITVVAPDGSGLRQVRMPDDFPTNICFGGADNRTAWVTLAQTGRLGRMTWASPGLTLNFAA